MPGTPNLEGYLDKTKWRGEKRNFRGYKLFHLQCRLLRAFSTRWWSFLKGYSGAKVSRRQYDWLEVERLPTW